MPELKFPKTRMKLKAEDLLQMNLKGLRALEEGLREVVNWFDGSPLYGHGKVISATLASEDLTLMMSTMRWLSHHVADPQVVLNFPEVYRITSVGRARISANSECLVKPMKPVSSWSSKRSIRVADRTEAIQDVLLRIKAPRNVIFSYKVAKYLDSKYAEAVSLQLERLPKGQQTPVIRTVASIFLWIVSLAYNLKNYRDEQEVVLYHGLKKFRAEVLEWRGGNLKKEVEAFIRFLTEKIPGLRFKISLHPNEANLPGSTQAWADLARLGLNPKQVDKQLRQAFGMPNFVDTGLGGGPIWSGHRTEFLSLDLRLDPKSKTLRLVTS